ncbi:MAG TPA: hypothetical protein VGQ75_10305 [Thermoanaerobaculia bacterium]|nr:hypothetical protein [Thermoanaerobaculia bacterium]HEV8608850.1 hypothetical protein [Thermoanaerobaculia bacterium]
MNSQKVQTIWNLRGLGIALRSAAGIRSDIDELAFRDLSRLTRLSDEETELEECLRRLIQQLKAATSGAEQALDLIVTARKEIDLRWFEEKSREKGAGRECG